MAFTFDADPTSATMNSYVSESDADDFFAGKFGAGDWSELDSANKQALLTTATRLFETFEFGGLKASRAQPLKWPRQGLYSNEGNAWTSVAVPVPMLQATCEQAYWTWRESERVLDDTTLQQYTDFSAGPLTVKINANAPTHSRDAIALINGMGQGTLINTGVDGSKAKSMTMHL